MGDLLNAGQQLHEDLEAIRGDLGRIHDLIGAILMYQSGREDDRACAEAILKESREQARWRT